MLVKEKMTKKPVSISKDNFISDAVDVFNSNDFHRLPVVDKSNRVIGLLTGSLVAENLPSKATSLSIHELNYLLNKTKVEDIMIKNPIVISPNALLEEAADIMVKNNVYCLPVVDQEFLVGIITQKDIFSAFIDLQGYYHSGTRLVIDVDNDRPGILRDIATILSAEGINITHLVVERDPYTNEVKVVVRADDSDSEKVVNLLKDSFKISDVRAS